MLQFVRGPVTEVERTGGAEFIGIAAGGDVLHVQLRAALDELLKRLLLQGSEIVGHGFDLLEKGTVTNERDFDGLDDAVAALTRGQRFQEGEVVHDGKGHCETADPVFLAEVVHAVLHSHAAIALAEGGGGETYVAYAAMGGGGGKADEIQRRAATDDEDVAVAVQRGFIDGVPAALDEAEVILAGFAAGDYDGVIHHGEGVRMHLAVGHDVVDQIPVGGGDGFIHKDEHARELVRLVEAKKVTDGVVPGRENFSREQDAVGVLKPDFFLQH